MLGIKPLLTIQGEKLDTFAKVRGTKRCKALLLESMQMSVAEYRQRGLDIRVEPDLHEWAPNTVDYAYLPQEEAGRRWHALHDNHGRHPAGEMPAWESAEQMKARVFAVLDKYRHCRCVIAVCHGTLMQYVLDIPHPSNGQIVRFDL